MRKWSEWRSEASARSERARVAACARWAAVRAARADERPRETRVVEISLRDTHRPSRQIRLQAEERNRSWSRWSVTEDGVRIGRRALGTTGIADLIARSIA